nr:hypothetical protein [Tanacetum cinerariifolium]
LENDHLNTVGKFHVVKPVPLPFIHEDADLLIKEKVKKGQARTEGARGHIPDSSHVHICVDSWSGVPKNGSETLLIHFRKQDITSSVFRVLMALPRVNYAMCRQGLQVYHDGEQRTLCYKSSSVSMILFYSSLDSYDKSKKVNDNGEYRCSYMEELAH